MAEAEPPARAPKPELESPLQAHGTAGPSPVTATGSKTPLQAHGTATQSASSNSGANSAPAVAADVFIAALTGYAQAYTIGQKLTTGVSVTTMRSFLNKYGAAFTASQKAQASTYLDTAAASTTVSDAAAIASVVYAIVANTKVPSITLSANIAAIHAVSATATTYVGLTEQKTIPPAFWTKLAATLTTLLNK